MYFLLKMVIFQPAILVCQRVATKHLSTVSFPFGVRPIFRGTAVSFRECFLDHLEPLFDLYFVEGQPLKTSPFPTKRRGHLGSRSFFHIFPISNPKPQFSPLSRIFGCQARKREVLVQTFPSLLPKLLRNLWKEEATQAP